ncbi:unnamed protein product [Plutella xylostella]|uniref:(diamondback moth) hypothetical protein n=1 Tax=Plutella xylostella TaxID=51655 RepID=A0A8S4E1C4_PLUXY|nr:unnamed protein product [Plutella xylostella]
MRRQNNMMMQPRDRLQDLDRELELLRRKRQLIEDQGQYGHGGRQTQHTISPWEQPMAQNNSYSQPRASYNQFDYGNMYESSGAGGGYEGGFGGARRRGKRPAPAPTPRWQDDVPKRFRGQQDAWPAQQYKPQAPKFAPRAPKPAYRPAARAPAPQRKPADKPAPKPEPKPAPKKVVVAEAQLEEYVLTEADLEGKLPRKVQGRLEFALGVVYKALRTRAGDKHPALFEHAGARLVKNALRRRLREALLGRAVPDVAAIVDAHAARFPPARDEELLGAAAAALAERQRADQELLAAPPDTQYLAQELPSDDPEDFFRKNITKVLEAKLQDVFKKVSQICEEPSDLEQLVKDADEATKKTPDAATDEATTNTTEEPAKPEEKAEGETQPKTEGDKVENRMEYFKKLMDGLINAELPKLLPNFEDELKRIFDADAEYLRARQQLARKSEVRARMAADQGKLNANKLPLMYVMVMGTPKLPKKVKLQAFLRSFHPGTIKKHRNVHNVLYVGFSDKTDLKNILAANDTLMDNVKLTIKESGKFQNPKTVLKQSETKSANTSIDNAIDSDLDGQINDLLTSIRSSEEAGQTEQNGGKNETTGDAATGNAEATEGQGDDGGDFTENWDEEATGNGNDASADFTENWDEELAKEAEANGSVVGNAENGNGGDAGNAENANETPAETAVAKNPQVAKVQQTTPTKQPAKAPATPTGINTRRSSRINNA